MRDSVEELFEKDVDFAAAPDVFPPDKFNAGVLLIVILKLFYILETKFRSFQETFEGSRRT